MTDFRDTRRLFRTACSKILKRDGDDAVKEAAFPAYAHPNPVVDYIFWKRLKVVYDAVRAPGTALDFGCGSGVMSYALGRKGLTVTGVDIELSPVEKIQREIAFPPSVRFVQGDLAAANFADDSLDYILALDVLYYVPDPGAVLKTFARILKPAGTLIFSLPTESTLYRIGRAIAMARVKGGYNPPNIKGINLVRERMSDYFAVKDVKRIVWPVVLFEISSAKRKTAGPPPR